MRDQPSPRIGQVTRLTAWDIEDEEEDLPPPADLLERGLFFGARARQLLTLALLVGGLALGGNNVPAFTIGLELLATMLLFAVLALPAPEPPLARAAKWLIVATCAIPLLQLVPLPFALWQALPGHELAARIQQEVGATGGYHALSLDPERTVRALLSLVVPIAMFLATLRAGDGERRLLMLAATAIVLISATMGVAQISSGELYPYPTPHQGTSTGVFANRNHHADLLLAGMFLVAAVARARSASLSARVLAVALILTLGACVITTISRMGNGLMPFAVLASAALLLAARGVRSLWWVGLAAALGAILFVLILSNPAVQATLARFGGSAEDGRFGFWSDTLAAAWQFWPTGSGLGTFFPIYSAFENLDAVTGELVNHAHNDWLELMLECGLPAVIVGLAYLALLVVLVSRLPSAVDWADRLAGLGIIVVILIHSGVDYPLRTFSLSILFAFANGLLLGSPTPALLQIPFLDARHR